MNMRTGKVVRVVDTPLLYSYVRVKLPVWFRVRIVAIFRDYACCWWEVKCEGLYTTVIVTDEEIWGERPTQTGLALSRLLRQPVPSARVELALRRLAGEIPQVG